ncbi:MAG: TRAP transporter small permease [Desulfitobacteriia bacterium]
MNIMNIFKALGRKLDYINAFFAKISAVLATFIVISISLEVFMRAAFNQPIRYIIEINEIIVLYITFLSAAYLLRNDSHVCVDLLLNRLKIKHSALLNCITSIFAAIACLIVTWFGFIVSHLHYSKGFIVQGTIFPRVIVTIIVPIGCLLLTFEFIRRAYRNYTLYKNQEKQ